MTESWAESAWEFTRTTAGLTVLTTTATGAGAVPRNGPPVVARPPGPLPSTRAGLDPDPDLLRLNVSEPSALLPPKSHAALPALAGPQLLPKTATHPREVFRLSSAAMAIWLPILPVGIGFTVSSPKKSLWILSVPHLMSRNSQKEAMHFSH
mmetsp:Transcript_24523/g.42164  ORF Transcript_24523/g.42164 Transcript_24523/m.42164 type:complete len:152 (-) Transcript_24523:389-844(-)